MYYIVTRREKQHFRSLCDKTSDGCLRQEFVAIVFMQWQPIVNSNESS